MAACGMAVPVAWLAGPAWADQWASRAAVCFGCSPPVLVRQLVITEVNTAAPRSRSTGRAAKASVVGSGDAERARATSRVGPCAGARPVPTGLPGRAGTRGFRCGLS
jgi:hypothetical protein